MNNFQVIGLRPLEGCHEDFRKILETKELYLFDNRYNVDYNDKGDIINISFDESQNPIPNNFYSSKLNMQINAVVGGNGSGKSALAELLLYFMFYYGIKKEQISRQQYSTDKKDDGYGPFRQVSYNKEINMMRVYLKVEVLFIYEGLLHKIILNNDFFEINVYERISNVYKLFKHIPFETFSLPFYSMYVNYSHYGLNTNIDGIWLRTLFHKNDGYQLPVVINPYREEGNININIENHLSRDRVFTNVINTEDESLILPNLEIDNIEIAKNSSKNIYRQEPDERREQALNLLIKPLYKNFFKGEEYPSSMNKYQSEVEDYLLHKLVTITDRYQDYKEHNWLIYNLSGGVTIKDNELELFLEQINKDRSHVTLKVRQSLNFLRHDFYQINYDEGSKHFNLHNVIQSINEIRDDQFFTDTIDYLPPPIFMTRFHFKDKSHFDQLSSGEKQQIYSIHSIIYHLKNLDSVHYSDGDKIKYNSVFLILDEIELYYHPQAQKKTIDRLLYVLEKSKLNYVKHLNVMFLTHSPFILSDIPSDLTLKLKDGRIFENDKNHKTFSANITDLLTDSFFLENGLMGDFAKRKIDEVLGFLNHRILSNEINNLERLLYKKEGEIGKTKQLELSYKKSLLEDFKAHEQREFSFEYIEKLKNLIDEPLLRYGVEKLIEKAKPFVD
ncbi:hypothetical protein FBALC1_11432 [Flavobacteriales bacterium ALC-1]|nr:hypothetical protein FBALC1_11432 [Flavobacteriales bacterium ALC-1]